MCPGPSSPIPGSPGEGIHFRWKLCHCLSGGTLSLADRVTINRVIRFPERAFRAFSGAVNSFLAPAQDGLGLLAVPIKPQGSFHSHLGDYFVPAPQMGLPGLRGYKSFLWFLSHQETCVNKETEARGSIRVCGRPEVAPQVAGRFLEHLVSRAHGSEQCGPLASRA